MVSSVSVLWVLQFFSGTYMYKYNLGVMVSSGTYVNKYTWVIWFLLVLMCISILGCYGFF